MLRPRIKDHRGTVTRLCPISAIPRRATKRFYRPVGAWAGVACATASLVLPLSAGHWITREYLHGPLAGLVLVLGVSVAWFVAVLALMLFVRQHQVRAVANRLVRQDICPACGYDLVGGRAEEDGCRVCPECGTAWRA